MDKIDSVLSGATVSDVQNVIEAAREHLVILYKGSRCELKDRAMVYLGHAAMFLNESVREHRTVDRGPHGTD